MVKRPFSPKRKGGRAEREIRGHFAETMKEVEAALSSVGTFHAFSDDVRRSSLQWFRPGKDILGLLPLSIEVKHQKRNLIGTWWAQCLLQAAPGSVPVLIYRLHHQRWRVRTFVILEDAALPDREDAVVADFDLPPLLSWYAKNYRAWLLRQGVRQSALAGS